MKGREVQQDRGRIWGHAHLAPSGSADWLFLGEPRSDWLIPGTSALIKQIFWKLSKGDKWRGKKQKNLAITAAWHHQPTPPVFPPTFSARSVAVGRCWIKSGLFASVWASVSPEFRGSPPLRMLLPGCSAPGPAADSAGAKLLSAKVFNSFYLETFYLLD